MTVIELAEVYSEMVGGMGELARAFLSARGALAEINSYNHISNDLQAYLFDLAEWGMSESDDRPQPESFGLQVAV